MNITILTTTTEHPVHAQLLEWKRNQSAHSVEVCTSLDEVGAGNMLFLISCRYLVKADVRNRFGATLIVHASDLPEGRGMSPHIWQILEGRSEITVSLLEAEDRLDTGRIWAQRLLEFQGHELFDEINDQLFHATFSLMDEAVDGFETITPRDQIGDPSALYPARTPADSEIDTSKSIASQFDQLRVADPDRFPAFFSHRGTRYTIDIRKSPED